MKVIDIAIKDLLSSFRSAIALVFMFVIPVAVTVLFYFMFGSTGQEDDFDVATTKVILVNQDQGNPQFLTQSAVPGISSLGQVISIMLQSPDFSSLLEITAASDAPSARAAVDRQKAGVAVMIPPNFTTTFLDPNQQAVLELYQDPTLTLGPSIVKSILDQLMDSFSGAKIAMSLAMAQSEEGDSTQAENVLNQYLSAASTQAYDSATWLETRAPASGEKSASPLLNVVTQIMGGMMIFYSFYTGTASAQSILQEDEKGTLPRLFTTPTSHATILGGKFLAVGLTVIIQMTVLVLFSTLVFGIRWGAPLPVALSLVGTVAASATMGVFINSLLKNTKQGGAVYGGLLTITGMLGMMPIFTQGLNTLPPALEVIPLFVPQGWAIRSLFQAVGGEPVLVSVLVLMAMSIVFFAVGVWRFTKRFV